MILYMGYAVEMFNVTLLFISNTSSSRRGMQHQYSARSTINKKFDYEWQSYFDVIFSLLIGK